jgi:hypothetical protein
MSANSAPTVAATSMPPGLPPGERALGFPSIMVVPPASGGTYYRSCQLDSGAVKFGVTGREFRSFTGQGNVAYALTLEEWGKCG